MLGVDIRALRVIWTVFLFALALLMVYTIRETLILFAVAIFFAYMLAPIVNLVERLTPKRRTLALAIVYIIFVGGIVSVGIALVSRIAEEATSLASHLPALLDQSRLQSLPLPSWLDRFRENILSAIRGEAANLQHSIVPILQHAGGQILSGLSTLVLTVLVPILSFFFLKDARTIRDTLVDTVEGPRRSLVIQISTDIHQLLSKYIRSLVLLSLASFVSWVIFLSLIQAPYQLLLSGIAALLEFIPAVGPLAACVIILIVCGVSGFPGLLWIIVFWIAFRLFQDYVLNPYLMSAGVEVPPLLVLFGVLAGERIGGIPGMFFSVPVIAIVRILVVRLAESHRAKGVITTS